MAASEADCDAVLDDTLAKFGYEGFRPGQREAIKRILRYVMNHAVSELRAGWMAKCPKVIKFKARPMQYKCVIIM